MKVNNLSQKYKQLRNDIKYIENNYGKVYDYCGGWCNNDLLDELLDAPNTKTAFKIMITMVERYFKEGYGHQYYTQLPVDKDIKLQKIKEKWIDIYYEV